MDEAGETMGMEHHIKIRRILVAVIFFRLKCVVANIRREVEVKTLGGVLHGYLPDAENEKDHNYDEDGRDKDAVFAGFRHDEADSNARISMGGKNPDVRGDDCYARTRICERREGRSASRAIRRQGIL